MLINHSSTKGRCARAGRRGTAFSLVSTDDEAHLLDLHLFLNRPFDASNTREIGKVPPDVLEDEHAMVMSWLKNQHIVSTESCFEFPHFFLFWSTYTFYSQVCNEQV